MVAECRCCLPANDKAEVESGEFALNGKEGIVVMSEFFSKLFHRRQGHRASEKINRAYVSDFTGFIDHYLAEHPEVLKEQHDGRLLYWDKKVDLAAQAKAEQDSAPDDGYGFYASAWVHPQKH